MNEKKVCKYCKKIFTPNSTNSGVFQKYCSRACSRSDYYENGTKHREDFQANEVIREFYCRHCGKRVYVVDKKDHRSTYCSAQCERAYWRDVTKYGNGSRRSRGGEAGISGGMSLGSLIRREKYALR